MLVVVVVVGLLSGVVQASNIQGGERLPIVFAHGMGVPYQLYERVVPLRKVFARLGYDLRIARTPLAGTLDERSRVLHDEIRRLVPDGRFHLLGHSMGGLDARLVVRRFSDVGARCVSVTTMATPHHGSAVADYIVAHVDEASDESSTVHRILEALGGALGGALDAARELTTANVEGRFNGRVIDYPGVRYLSLGFFIPEPVERHSVVPLLWVLHSIGVRQGQPHNDGLVSVESAEWGESLGVLPADHWSETSPLPFIGGKNYREVAEVVARALDARFGAPAADESYFRRAAVAAGF